MQPIDVAPPINHFRGWGTSLNLDWQVADWLDLKSITAYRRYTNNFAEDTDGSPLAVQQLLQRLKHTQWSQELRATGNVFNGFLDYAVGGFYMHQTGAEDARVDLPYVGFDFLHGPDSTPSTNEAAYMHLTFHPFKNLDVAGGVRYSHDEKTYTFARHNIDGTLPLPCSVVPLGFPNPWFWESGNPVNCGVAGVDGLSSSFSSQRWDYRGAIDYQWTDNIMTYVQISTGYKGGGVNARPFFPSQLHAYSPEVLTTYEVGLKSTFWNMIRFNADGFWNVYKGIQLPQTTCTWASPGQQNPCASQNNVGDAHVWGLEAEIEAHPTDAIELDASMSYLHFEYTSLATDPVTHLFITDTRPGMITPYTPNTKFSLGAQYRLDLSSGLGSITPRVDYSYQTHIYTDPNNRPSNFIPGYGLMNMRVTWNSEDSFWAMAFEMTNVLDEYYYLSLFDLTKSATGYVFGQPAMPREWAFTLKRKF